MTQQDLLQPKKILKDTKEPHPQFLNNSFCDPYSGCEFGCLYCYGIKEENIDQGEAVSPHRVGIKTSCPFSFKNELTALQAKASDSDNMKNSIGFGFSSDPYQPCEDQYRLTQRCLEIVKENNTPIQILTKSELVLRDIKILSELSDRGLVVVSISLFTLKEKLYKLFEPRVPPPKKRLELIKKLRNADIVCGAVLMPILPRLTDSREDLQEMFSQLESHGAQYCVPGVLNLSHPPVRNRVFKSLHEHLPEIYTQYQALYNEAGHPPLSYCEKIAKTLSSLSEKHQIPTVLPIEPESEQQNLIVKDIL